MMPKIRRVSCFLAKNLAFDFTSVILESSYHKCHALTSLLILILLSLVQNKNLSPQLSAIQTDPKLSGYLQNLNALEAEKHSMEQQLQDAQQQQNSMLKKLEEMKSMVSMFNQMSGKVGGSTVQEWS